MKDSVNGAADKYLSVFVGTLQDNEREYEKSQRKRRDPIGGVHAGGGQND